ncbi:hypothetical protein B0H12DRAFT_1331270 [Mycena haematopus]|nr:hypothetical protein B0H12DRAFT_1331270 [Mycena haematopus]
MTSPQPASPTSPTSMTPLTTPALAPAAGSASANTLHRLRPPSRSRRHRVTTPFHVFGLGVCAFPNTASVPPACPAPPGGGDVAGVSLLPRRTHDRTRDVVRVASYAWPHRVRYIPRALYGVCPVPLSFFVCTARLRSPDVAPSAASAGGCRCSLLVLLCLRSLDARVVWHDASPSFDVDVDVGVFLTTPVAVPNAIDYLSVAHP